YPTPATEVPHESQRRRVFRDDLMVLASNGLPLWDGVADIQVRQALPGRRRNGGHPAPSRFARAISRGKPIHASLFSSYSPILTDARGDEGGQGSSKRSSCAPPGGQGKAHGQSIGIDDRMNLAREITAQPTHQLFSISA